MRPTIFKMLAILCLALATCDGDDCGACGTDANGDWLCNPHEDGDNGNCYDVRGDIC